MGNITLTPPPGVARKGTLMAVKYRWYETKWVRWYEGVMQAIGGFQSLIVGGGGTVTNGVVATSGGESYSGYTPSMEDTATGLPTGLTAYGELAETASGVEIITAPGTPPTDITKALKLNAGTNSRWGLGIDAYDDIFQFGDIVTLSYVASASNGNLPGPTFAMSGVTDGTLAHEYMRLRLQGGGTQVGTQAMGHSGGGDSFYGSENDETLTFAGTWIWCRKRVTDDGGGNITISARVWTGDFGDEPGTFQYTSGSINPRNDGPLGALGVSAEGFGDVAYLGYIGFSTDEATVAVPGPADIGGPAAQASLSEAVRGTHSWRNNEGDFLLSYGGPTVVHVLDASGVTDITPTGMTTGQASASRTSGGYNAAATDYGEGAYGYGDPTADLTEANTYQMDNYGEDLVFTSYADGRLFYWDSSAAGLAAVITPTAGTVPTGNAGVVVTPENFIMCLGANSNPRTIFWNDQDTYTDWDITSVTNQAGSMDLPGRGTILAGRRAQSETLVWTDVDLFSIRYIGGTFIYTAVPVGAVGAISRRSMAVVGSVAYWMSQRGFHIYNGFTESIPCEVADYVFSDINRTQASKIWAEVREEFGEIAWHYCSSDSEECNRAVIYNYKENFWFLNELERTAGEDGGVLERPIAFDASGNLWQHELGATHGGDTPEATSGPIELGQGDNVMHVQSWIPDEATLGEVDMYLLTSMYPTDMGTDDEIENGPYTPSEPTDLRSVARQIRIRIVQAAQNWRLGMIRLDVEPGSKR